MGTARAEKKQSRAAQREAQTHSTLAVPFQRPASGAVWFDWNRML